MKNIIITFIGAVIGWAYFFYARKSDAKRKMEWSTKILYFGYDLKVLIMAIVATILTIYFLVDYLINDVNSYYLSIVVNNRFTPPQLSNRIKAGELIVYC
mgnify:CR=1 FL=1